MAEQNERKLYDLKVDSEFRDLIPPLSAEELKLLEDSIAANGCESPIIVWNGAIVDGHNRYAICRKRGIPFLLHEKEFESRDAAMLWMLRNQLSRRNLNSYQKSDLALRLEPLLAEEAKKRKGMRTDLVQNSDRGSETGRTGNKLGKLAGVSHDTIQKVKKLNALADEATREKLRRGEVSVHKAYTDVVEKEHAGETKICERCKCEKPLSAFALPSNRRNFSSICKACEKEINEAARIASEVATAKPCSIPGMAMHNGAPIHVEQPLPDTQDMFTHIAELMRSCCESYRIGVESVVRRYTRGMENPEHNALLLEMAHKANELALKILNDRIEEA